MKQLRWFVFGLSLGTVTPGHAADAPPLPPPDPRLKADVLLVLAHPDDETLLASYLARAVLDEKRRVAVVFTTRGESGMNAVGFEQAASLGALREMEARRALASFGIIDVWFLDGRNVSSQDPLQSLEIWGHGAVLERAVRFFRLTRPEVVISLLPGYTIGENHGDHQAAGVIATEAFDMAGDPAAFPEQLAAPRNHRKSRNLTEGLRPWQAKKIYFVSDALGANLLFNGTGPLYASTDVSPSRKVPYYKLAAEEMGHYLSQDGKIGKDAAEKGDYGEYLKYWRDFVGTSDIQLIWGKSVVGGVRTGGIFEGVTPDPAPWTAPRARPPKTGGGFALALGGVWGFYREFWRAHDLEHLARPGVPVAGVPPGSALVVPLLLQNGSSKPIDVTLSVTSPDGWTETSAAAARYVVPAHQTYPVQAAFAAPKSQGDKVEEMLWKATAAGGHQPLGVVSIGVRALDATMPQ